MAGRGAHPDFEILDSEVELRPQGPRRSRPAATARDIMTDLFGALQRSVEAAKVASGDASPEGTSSEGTKASVPVQQTGVKKKAPGKAGPKRTRHTA